MKGAFLATGTHTEGENEICKPCLLEREQKGFWNNKG